MSVDHSQWLAAQGDDAPLLMKALAAGVAAGTRPASLGVAVSGGSDSMAMLHLMARAAPLAGWALRAVTVDHRLRREASAEAAFVGETCAGLGLAHDVLVWDHGDVPGNLMQAAREARYGLMAAWAKRHGVGLVTLAHTADDQAETFLMGLSRAAGLDGLSGMRPAFRIDGVAFHRPFLSLTRAELRAFLTRHNQPWIDDPSNENDRFTRIKARGALKALGPLGINVDRLCAVISNLSAVQGLVQHTVAVAAEAAVAEEAGALRFAGGAFGALHPETRRRLLIAMIRWISGVPHPPREAKLSALERALRLGKDATLGGVRFRWCDQTCWVSREARACGVPVPAGQVWDGRWHLTGAGGELRALGPEGLRQCPDWRATGLPRQVLEVTPGLWHGAHLQAAPCAIFGSEAATCAPSFREFILSH